MARLDHFKSEHNKVEEDKSVVSHVTKLKQIETEYKANPTSKLYPTNPQSKLPNLVEKKNDDFLRTVATSNSFNRFATNSDKKCEETLSAAPAINQQNRFPSILEKKTEEQAKPNAFRTAKEQLVYDFFCSKILEMLY